MSASQALHGRLAAVPAITVLVGDRIEPGNSALGPYPRIVFSVDDESAIHSHDGYAGLSSALMTISILSSTKLEALAVAALVFAALDNQGGEWGGVTVQRAYFQNQDEQIITAAELGIAENVYLVEVQYSLWFHGP